VFKLSSSEGVGPNCAKFAPPEVLFETCVAIKFVDDDDEIWRERSSVIALPSRYLCGIDMLTSFRHEGYCIKTCGVEISHFLTPCKIKGWWGECCAC